MLIRCALYVSGVQPASSETVWIPEGSARHFEVNAAGGRAYVSVIQLDDDPTAGLPRSFGIVPPGPNSPAWAASPNGVMALAAWWSGVVAGLGVVG
jgi:hypothetical protein